MNARLPRRDAGALLLTVVLLLAVMAALAFSLGRGAGMGAHAVASDYERRNAAYLLQAAVAAAKWTNQVNKCGNAAVGVVQLGTGSASATASKSGGNLNVTASATTAAGLQVTQTRSVAYYDLYSTPENKNLGSGLVDTTITSGVTTVPAGTTPPGSQTTLTLASRPAKTPSNALLYWKLDDVPGGSLVLSANLSMTQNTLNMLAPNVSVQRVTTQWSTDPAAAATNWTTARPGKAWNGGDYAATPVASASAGMVPGLQWNLTGLVASWFGGLLPNDGILLLVQNANPTLNPNASQSASFYSFDTPSTGLRPTLNVSFAKPCK